MQKFENFDFEMKSKFHGALKFLLTIIRENWHKMEKFAANQNLELVKMIILIHKSKNPKELKTQSLILN